MIFFLNPIWMAEWILENEFPLQSHPTATPTKKATFSLFISPQMGTCRLWIMCQEQPAQISVARGCATDRFPFPFHWVLLRSKLQPSAREIMLSLSQPASLTFSLTQEMVSACSCLSQRAYWVTLHRQLHRFWIRQLPPGLSPGVPQTFRKKKKIVPASQSQKGARSKCRTPCEIKQNSHSDGC